MLADVGLQFLAAMGIIGFPKGLCLRPLQGESTAFRAGLETLILASMCLHHNLVAVGAMVWRKLQCLQPALQSMDIRQGKSAILPQPSVAYRTFYKSLTRVIYYINQPLVYSIF